MKWILIRWTAWILAIGASTSGQARSVVVYDDAVTLHQELAEALERRSDGTLRLLPISERHGGLKPDVVFAIGDRAAESAATRWPKAPRAELLRWRPPGVVPPSGRGAPVAYASAHPATACTVDSLQTRMGSQGWLVVAGPEDPEAAKLAGALGANLIQGSLADVAKQLRVLPSPPTHVWVRAHPDHAKPAWVSQLQHLARLPGVAIGTDAPGLARDGIEQWVTADLESLADQSLGWAKRLRRAKAPWLRVLSVECAKGSGNEAGP